MQGQVDCDWIVERPIEGMERSTARTEARISCV